MSCKKIWALTPLNLQVRADTLVTCDRTLPAMDFGRLIEAVAKYRHGLG